MNPITVLQFRVRLLSFSFCLLPVLLADDVPAGERVTLAAAADGVPAPSFIWMKDGKEIHRGPTFVIVSMAPAHDGAYIVRAVNTEGQADSPPFVLKTIPLPAPPLPAPPVVSDVKAVTLPK